MIAKFVEKITKKAFNIQKLFSENRAVYMIMVAAHRPQMAI